MPFWDEVMLAHIPAKRSTSGATPPDASREGNHMQRFVDCSHKRAYRTEREATEVAEHQMQRNPGLVLRVYTCPSCGYYHLTSKLPR